MRRHIVFVLGLLSLSSFIAIVVGFLFFGLSSSRRTIDEFPTSLDVASTSQSLKHDGFGYGEADSVVVTRPGARSLLYVSEPDTALVKPKTELHVDLSGTVSLKDKSERVLWSFKSGSPIYSSYRAPTNADRDSENASEPSNSFFLDYEDDWTLYAQDKHHGRMNLTMTVEDFLKITPHVSHDGVILGSKKTSVFVVDGKNGRLVRVYESPDSSSKIPSDADANAIYKSTKDNKLVKPTSGNAAEVPLHITRTDYKLECFGSNSNTILWNLTVAYFGAASLCHDFGIPSNEATLNSDHGTGSETDSDFDMPLSCQSVIEIRRQAKSEFASKVLPEPSSNLMLPSDANIDASLENQHETEMLSSLYPDHDLASQSLAGKASSFHQSKVSKVSSALLVAFCLVSCIIVAVSFSIYYIHFVPHEMVILRGQPRITNLNSEHSKKKKNRKSGKKSGIAEKKDNQISSGSGNEFPYMNSDNKMLLDTNKISEGGTYGRKIGKLFVSYTEIANGSNGTLVLEGNYEGRSVAVKRLNRSHHDIAYKEIQNLIASDCHPNIVRWYGVEHDQDFVYLALERCSFSLDDLIHTYSVSLQNRAFGEKQGTQIMNDYGIQIDLGKGNMRDLNLWNTYGRPSPLLLKLMRDMVSGIAHLHELGIIHRDLKPQNVLILKERSICAKLSDMGISKRLLEDMSSLGNLATGCGSSGWQAPEQLLNGRQTRALDLFSLGCVIYFCITGGRHPFGHRLERDINIVKNKMNLFFVEHIPEALDLISRLLNPHPEQRPSALEVLNHPLFWSSEVRLSFLRDTSDRVELEDREPNSHLLKALESTASMALGVKWNERMEPAFMTNIGLYRRYKFDSVRDLLRVMRNKLNHYRELPREIQELVGPVPVGFDEYFATRFPRLLIEVYKVMWIYCREEASFHKYIKSNVV